MSSRWRLDFPTPVLGHAEFTRPMPRRNRRLPSFKVNGILRRNPRRRRTGEPMEGRRVATRDVSRASAERHEPKERGEEQGEKLATCQKGPPTNSDFATAKT